MPNTPKKSKSPSRSPSSEKDKSQSPKKEKVAKSPKTQEKDNESSFDIDVVIDNFRKAQLLDGDIDLQEYILAYKELNKMFRLLGRLFTFVESDVSEKENILQEFIQKDKENYGSVKKMIEYELDKKMTQETDPPSGCRTFLRLHRALEFVIHFVDGLNKAKESDKMSSMCRKAYDNTLAKFHPWYVRKPVQMAVYTLPTRKQLISDLSHKEPTSEETHEILSQIVIQGQAVYDKCQTIYANNNILDLP